MIDHEQAQELLTLRAFGEMDESEANRLARHLGSCSDCRRFDQEFAQGIGRLGRLEGPPRAGSTPTPAARPVGKPPAPARPPHQAPLARCGPPLSPGGGPPPTPAARPGGKPPAPAWRRQLAPLAACAASFAAGICVTLAIQSGSGSMPTPPSPPSQRVEGTFARESPPPLATTLGVLTLMSRSVPH